MVAMARANDRSTIVICRSSEIKNKVTAQVSLLKEMLFRLKENNLLQVFITSTVKS